MTEFSSAQPNQIVPESELRTLAGFLFNLIEAQITRADTKAGLVIAADSVFATGAIFQARHGAILALFDSAAPVSARLISLLMLLMFGALFLSMMYGLFAARPALRVNGGGETLFFFNRIAQFQLQEFLEAFSRQTPSEFHAALLTEVYNTARIASIKFTRIRSSIDYLIAAVVLWLLIQIALGLTPG